MNRQPTFKNKGFDRYADDYDSTLARGISISGESKTFFAEGRVQWLTRCLAPLNFEVQTVMDFGCGTGSATPFLRTLAPRLSLVGVDISAGSLEIARRDFAGPQTQFHEFGQYQPAGQIDLAFCNGVFHHIPLKDRAPALGYVRNSLRPGGLFALWENNPWNPGTRYVMSRIPFDHDAIQVPPGEARRLVRAAGFEILRHDFIFLFPRFLSALRWIEPLLAKWPLGAQYQLLCRRRG